MNKKRHHYVPKAYLKFFCDDKGKIRVYLKDHPRKTIYQAPDNVAFHKYYYSQPLPEGGKDHSALEDFFSKLEAKWPPIVERLQRQEDVRDNLVDLFTFIAVQRVRVPANRDACERMLAELVKVTARRLDKMGELQPKPEGFEDILDHVEFAIDPHQSIHSMVHMLDGVCQVLDQVGIGALHNITDIPFLTSDNPVIWFDPSVPEAKLRPYALQPGGPIVFLFPVTPSLMIYGHSSMLERFTSDGFQNAELTEAESAEVMNRMICRFAYRTVFAQKPGQEILIHEYANVSPVVRTDVVHHEKGEFILHQHVFGKRERKPKWIS